MTWYFIALISYIFTALANVFDKLVLTRFLKAASVYAFYVGVLGVIALLLIPFGFQLTTWTPIFFGVISGAGFIVSLYFMYSGFLRGETTRAATVMGGTLPIFTLVISYFIFNERLGLYSLTGIFLLILGVYVIGLTPDGKHDRSYIKWALLAGVAFSLTYVGTKITYEMTNFITGFVWINIGSILASLSLLLRPKWNKEIMADIHSPKKAQVKSKTFMLFNQSMGALGFLLLSYAISLGPVSIINAMQGSQYAFVFILSAAFGVFIPEVKEGYSKRVVFQKAIAILIIGLGLIFVAI